MMAAKKATGKKATGKKATAKKSSAKRTEIAPNGDKRYIKRDSKGRIKESVEEGRSLSDDARRHAKKVAKPGFGDQGDQKRSSKKK